ADVVVVRPAGIRGVACGLLEYQLDLLLRAVDHQPPALGQIDRRLIRLRVVGEKDVAPAAARLDVADVQDATGEVLKEDAGLDVAVGPGRDDVQRDLSIGLIGRWQGDDGFVRRRRGRQHRQQHNRPKDPEHADAAGLERHELAVGREPSEPEQDAEKQRHWNRDAERLRGQRPERVEDRRPGNNLLDQPFALVEDRRHHQGKGEADQRDRQRRHDLANEIAVENLQHRRSSRLHPMTQVALLWHMHQPYYEDLVTREHILPWVRLHALKDYYGMVALLREFPDVRMTFNVVPSLLIQLEAFAAGQAQDRYLDLTLKAAADLDEGDVDFILENFFHAQRQHMIDAYPRYGELLVRRGGALTTL